MNVGRDRRRLGRSVARTLRLGTLVAMTIVGAGFVLALIDGSTGRGPTPLGDLLGGGGADGLIAAGLLALTLIPVAAVAVATFELGRAGERRRAGTAALAFALLVASLLAAALIAGSG